MISDKFITKALLVTVVFFNIFNFWSCGFNYKSDNFIFCLVFSILIATTIQVFRPRWCKTCRKRMKPEHPINPDFYYCEKCGKRIKTGIGYDLSD